MTPKAEQGDFPWRTPVCCKEVQWQPDFTVAVRAADTVASAKVRTGHEHRFELPWDAPEIRSHSHRYVTKAAGQGEKFHSVYTS